MQIKVKICGITNIDDAVAAVDFGADALGFVFFEKSPRYISHADAAAIIKKLPSFTTTIGVFVNVKPDQVEKIIDLTHLVCRLLLEKKNDGETMYKALSARR